jgi:uncharacterized protein YkwD
MRAGRAGRRADRKRRRWLAAVTLAAACAGIAATPAHSALPPAITAPCPNAHAEPGTVAPRALGVASVCLVNRVRVGRGVPRLRVNPHLNAFAGSFTRRMVGQQFFAHDVPGGPTFVQRANSSSYARSARGGVSMGENLAWATGSLATPAAMVDAWMSSPGHRANILRRDFRDIGFGVVAAAPESGMEGFAPATYVHAFGRRARR